MSDKPRLPKRSKKNTYLMIRMTDEDKREWSTLARKDGIYLSEWVRRRIHQTIEGVRP